MTPVVAARLDAELVRRGLARSRTTAAELVAEGRVSLAGTLARKPSQPVSPTQPLEVRDVRGAHYVSRAAHKLAGALEVLDTSAPGAIQVAGAHCLDAGASTGGFTQVLLERGAAHVDAVDVGHGQISPVVATDPRVTVHEGVNVRDLDAARLTARPRTVVADLSFISLTLVTAPLLALTVPGGNLLLMVKPQFEVGRERLGAGGVVTSATLRRESVLGVARGAAAAGAEVRAVVPSSLPGPSGNREYFLWLATAVPPAPADEQELTDVQEHNADDELIEAVEVAVLQDRPVLLGAGAR